MEYRKIGDNYYIRMDRGDEIISNLLEICEKESIPSAVFSGIGGCQSAELQVFIPETGSFETEQLEGMLELVSLNGNVVRDDDGKLFHHTHIYESCSRPYIWQTYWKDIRSRMTRNCVNWSTSWLPLSDLPTTLQRLQIHSRVLRTQISRARLSTSIPMKV